LVFDWELTLMGRYLEIFRRDPTECEIGEESEKSARSTTCLRKKGDLFRNDHDGEDNAREIRASPFAANPLPEDLFRLIRFFRTFQELERRCPLHINPADWQQAIDDGRKFLARWGQQAETLGWTPRDLFSLHAVPERPAANYRRLSRYDETGLIWLLRSRPVIALTETTAAIQGATAVLTYRKLNKPALGPVGDSLDDFEVQPLDLRP
jgi:hypothetical protein